MRFYKAQMLLYSFFIFSCNDNKIDTSPLEQKNEEYKQPKIIDIMSIIRKSPDEVKKAFGIPYKTIKNPKDCASLSECSLELQFKKGGVTVLFNNNQALWFDFEKLDSLKFSNMSTIFGLEHAVPKSVGGNDLMWYENYSGIKNIAFIESKTKPGYIDYAIVTVE